MLNDKGRKVVHVNEISGACFNTNLKNMHLGVKKTSSQGEKTCIRAKKRSFGRKMCISPKKTCSWVNFSNCTIQNVHLEVIFIKKKAATRHGEFHRINFIHFSINLIYFFEFYFVARIGIVCGGSNNLYLVASVHSKKLWCFIWCTRYAMYIAHHCLH